MQILSAFIQCVDNSNTVVVCKAKNAVFIIPIIEMKIGPGALQEFIEIGPPIVVSAERRSTQSRMPPTFLTASPTTDIPTASRCARKRIRLPWPCRRRGRLPIPGESSLSSRSTFTVRGNVNGIGDTNTRRDIEGLRSLGDLDARDRGLHARLNLIRAR